MRFKSKAQRRKFAQLLVEGKITPETYEEWNRETGGATLPERVKHKKKPSSRKKATSRAAARKPGKRAPQRSGGNRDRTRDAKANGTGTNDPIQPGDGCPC